MTTPVRIPADIDLPDRVIGPLTARQLAILTTAGLVIYGCWDLTRTTVPLPVFLAVATPIGALAAVLALGRRDGMPLDRLVLAAIRQRSVPRLQVAGPPVRPAPAWLTLHANTADEHCAVGSAADRGRRHRGRVGPLHLPAQAVADSGPGLGLVDLGDDGYAVVAVASTVNFTDSSRAAGRRGAVGVRAEVRRVPMRRVPPAARQGDAALPAAAAPHQVLPGGRRGAAGAAHRRVRAGRRAGGLHRRPARLRRAATPTHTGRAGDSPPRRRPASSCSTSSPWVSMTSADFRTCSGAAWSPTCSRPSRRRWR